MKKKLSPENIFAIASRQIVSNVLPTLVRNFDFFNQLKKMGPATINDIAKNFSFDSRVLEATLCYLLKENYLQMTLNKKGEFFSLSKMANKYLLKDGEFDFSPLVLMLNEDINKKAEKAIVSALTNGKPAQWSDKFGTWENTMRSDPKAKTFSASMMCRGMYLRKNLIKVIAPILKKYKNLIDIGGSMGDYCGFFAQQIKNLNCTVFDFPEVIKSAKQNIANKKYIRVNTFGGDMFKQIPKGYDVHFYSNVLHDWRLDQASFLLKKSYQSLATGGAIIIHDLFINDDKKSPSHGIDHSLNLAIFTQGKYYTCAETTRILKSNGFKKIKIYESSVGYKAIVGYK